MAVGLSVFLLSVALFMGVLYQYFGDQITGELENGVAGGPGCGVHGNGLF